MSSSSASSVVGLERREKSGGTGGTLSPRSPPALRPPPAPFPPHPTWEGISEARLTDNRKCVLGTLKFLEIDLFQSIEGRPIVALEGTWPSPPIS